MRFLVKEMLLKGDASSAMLPSWKFIAKCIQSNLKDQQPLKKRIPKTSLKWTRQIDEEEEDVELVAEIG